MESKQVGRFKVEIGPCCPEMEGYWCHYELSYIDDPQHWLVAYGESGLCSRADEAIRRACWFGTTRAWQLMAWSENNPSDISSRRPLPPMCV